MRRLLSALALATLAACKVTPAGATPPPEWLTVEVAPSPDSLCYGLTWPVVSDAAGPADSYTVNVSTDRSPIPDSIRQSVSDHQTAVCLAPTAPGATLHIWASVAAVRRGLTGEARTAEWLHAEGDVAPPAPDSIVVDSSAVNSDSVTPDPIEDVPPVLGAAFAAPRATSPHFDFIRRTFTDFCYCWPNPLSLLWAAKRYDLTMSGKAEDWMRANPTGDQLRYVLLWSTLDEGNNDPPSVSGKFLEDMRAWYAAHPEYGIETAFLHERGDVPADSAHRLHPHLWSTDRFIGNPTDPGWLAYTLDRFRRMAGETTRTGLFVDEMDDFNLRKLIGPAREFTDSLTWQDAIVAQVAEIRAAIAPKMLQVNPAGYGYKALDVRIALAAGSVHLETMNHATQDLPPVWTLVDSLIRRGVYVDMVSLEGWMDFVGGKGQLSRESYYPRGLYGAPVYRAKVVQLASYYMVVPADPQKVGLQTDNVRAPITPDSVELELYSLDVGHPKAPRSVWLDIRDPVNQRARVFRRDFDNAVVLIRPVVYWADTVLTDTTAVPVPLPAGSWSMVTARGGMVPVDSLALRNSEAVILVRRP